MPYAGELLSLFVAVVWTITALFAEVGSRRFGSIQMNVLRMAGTLLFLGGALWLLTGSAVPVGMDVRAWGWFLLSGVVGFVLGDWCLFNSYVVMGSRFGQLMMTLAPLFAALAGRLFLDERLTLQLWIGMAITLAGIGIAVSGRAHHTDAASASPGPAPGPSPSPAASSSGLAAAFSSAPAGPSSSAAASSSGPAPTFSSPTAGPSSSAAASSSGPAPTFSSASCQVCSAPGGSPAGSLSVSPPALPPVVLGVLLGLGAAAGQGVGIVLSKMGMVLYHAPYAAVGGTFVRAIAGLLGFLLIYWLRGDRQRMRRGLHDRVAVASALGTIIMGPCVGVSLSLVAVTLAPAGIASTLMAMTPIFILWPSRWLTGQPVTARQVVGSVVAVVGTAVLFLD